jgi:transcriptional regulator with XRE-family HTH domain
MPKKTRKKGDKKLVDFVRRVRGATGLSEQKFAFELGLPKATLRALSQAKRKVSDYDLALILLATGAEPSESVLTKLGTAVGDRNYSSVEYAQWKKVRDAASADAEVLIQDSLDHAKKLLLAAAEHGRLLVALYLFEMQLLKSKQNFGLSELNLEFKLHSKGKRVLTGPINLLDIVLYKCMFTAQGRDDWSKWMAYMESVDRDE